MPGLPGTWGRSRPIPACFGAAPGPDAKGPEASPELPGAGMISSVLASQEAALGGGLGEKECSWPRGGGEVRSLGY